MRQAKIKAEIAEGLFPSERIVTIKSSGGDTQTFVNASSVDAADSTVTVEVLDQDQAGALVRIGNNTMVVVKNEMLIE